MYLHLPKINKFFLGILLLLLVILLLLIPVRPSQWSLESLEVTNPVTLPTAPTLSNDTANGEVMFIPWLSISYALLGLTLFALAAWGLYQWITRRWQQKYWLEYQAKLPALAEGQANPLDLDDLFSVPTTTVSQDADQQPESVATTNISTPIPATNQDSEAVLEEVVEPPTTPEEPIAAVEPDVSTPIAPVTPAPPSKLTTALKAFFTRFPSIGLRSLKGLWAMVQYLSKKETSTPAAPREPLTWKDIVALIAVILFWGLFASFYNYAPPSDLVLSLSMPLLIFGTLLLPSIICISTLTGIIGIIICVIELMIILILVFLIVLGDMDTGGSMDLTWFWNTCIVFAVVAAVYFLFESLSKPFQSTPATTELEPTLNLPNPEPEPIPSKEKVVAALSQPIITNLHAQTAPRNWFQKMRLEHLEKLDASDWQRADRAEFLDLYLAECLNLRYLDLSSNELEQLPDDVVFVEQLEHLDLSNNQFTELPSELPYFLEQLSHLNLSGNAFTVIPSMLKNLPKLAQLNLCDNPIPLKAIIELQELLPLVTILHNSTEDSEVQAIEAIVDDKVEETAPEYWEMPEKLKMAYESPNEVYFLDLSYSNLSFLPEHAFLPFPELNSIYLTSNQFTQIPNAVLNISKITYLNLSKNQLTAISDNIAKLSQLKDLDLSKNPIKTFSPKLKGLKELRQLNLNGTGLTRVPKFVWQLKQLRDLSIGDNHLLEDLTELKTLPKLRKLDLSFSGISYIPDAVRQLKNLEELYWAGNSLDKLPVELLELSNLDTISLSYNDNMTFTPNILNQLPKLSWLFYNGNKVASDTPIWDELQEYKNLEHLGLSDNILHEIPTQLVALTKIKQLNLSFNKISAFSVEKGQWPSLKELDLSYNPIKKLPENIQYLKHLKSLELRGNEISENERQRLRKLLPNTEILF